MMATIRRRNLKLEKNDVESYRPRSAPSASRISANRIMGPPNTASAEQGITMDTPVAVPST